ncbi:MAG: hypothetical protein LBB50_00955, partial [Oscillospiraceae bacterium]|nr:hypothetical protein [Oscillospiraceae bacterium]
MKRPNSKMNDTFFEKEKATKRTRDPLRAKCFARPASALLAMVMVVCCAFGLGAPVVAKTEQQLQKEIEEKNAAIAAAEDEIAQLEKEQAAQKKLLPALEMQKKAVEKKADLIKVEVDRLSGSVAKLLAQIEALDADIAGHERQLDEITELTTAKEAQIAQLQLQLMERLRQQYVAGPVSNLQLLLSSEDVAGMLTVYEYISRQAERDEQLRRQLEEDMVQYKVLLAQLETETQALEDKKLELQKQGAALTQELVEQKEQQDSLNEELNKISDTQRRIAKIIDGMEEDSQEARALIRENNRAIQALEEALDRKKVPPGVEQVAKGTMRWPFPYRDCYITSRFGEVSSTRGGAPHKGLDISIGNKSREYLIIAALDGTILDHGFNSAMGNYVMIYHGYYEPKGTEIRTTYMHMKY